MRSLVLVMAMLSVHRGIWLYTGENFAKRKFLQNWLNSKIASEH